MILPEFIEKLLFYEVIKINKQKKYILIAGAVILFFGLIYRLAPFFQDVGSTDTEIILKEKRLEKYRQILRQATDLEARLIFLNRSLDRLEAGLLTGKTPSLAAVDLQNILNDIAGRTGVDIKTVRVLKHQALEEELYLRIPIQFSISSDIGQLKKILYSIRSSSKNLTVQKLDINVAKRGNSRKINSNITIAGFMKKTEKQAVDN